MSIRLTNASVAITLPTAALLSSSSAINVGQDKQFSIVLYLMQDGTGSRTVDWSLNTIYWPATEGVPVLSTTAGHTDIITFTTLDGGISYFGVFSAKGFTTSFSASF